MKTIFGKSLAAAAVAILSLTACDSGSGNSSDRTDSTLVDATNEQLRQAVSERDALLHMMNDLQGTLDEINRLEQIVSITPPGETSQVANINSELEALRATLEDRRKKIDELEARLRSSETSNQDLLATVNTMRSQLEMQGQQIEMLSTQLADANRQIGDLNTQVTELTEQVAQVTEQRDSVAAEAVRQTDLNNTVYYALGSKTELKEHNIVEGGGFLRKSKIMEGEFDRGYFTQADMRTLTTIPLYSKKAKVLTRQPSDSYQIVTAADGQKSIKILDPQKFWAVSNFLVVQID